MHILTFILNLNVQNIRSIKPIGQHLAETIIEINCKMALDSTFQTAEVNKWTGTDMSVSVYP